MKQMLILLGVVVALGLLAGCDRPSAEDDRGFDSEVDGFGFGLGGNPVPVSLGADQAAIAESERNRIAAAMTPTAKPKASPLDDTGLKPTTRPGTETDTTGTGADATGTDTPATATGADDKTGTDTTAPGTDKTGTGTGGKSAIDDILGGDG